MIITWVYLRNKQHREIDTKLNKTNELDDNAEKNKNKDETTINTTMIYWNETTIQLDTKLFKESYLDLDAMKHLDSI